MRPESPEDEPAKHKLPPTVERLSREVLKIEAKLKAKGLPFPGKVKPINHVSASARVADHPPASHSTPLPSDATPLGNVWPAVPGSPAAGTSRGASPGSMGTWDSGPHSRAASPGNVELSPEEQLAAYLLLKPKVLRLDLHGRKINGQKPKPKPPPSPPPTPPPLTSVQRLDLLLDRHTANLSLLAGQPWSARQGRKPSAADNNRLSPRVRDGESHSDSTAQAAGSPAATASDHPTTQAWGWSPTQEARPWAATVAGADMWVRSPAELRALQLPGLLDPQAPVTTAAQSTRGHHQRARSPGSPKSSAGHGMHPGHPDQRIDAALEGVATGAITLRAARPEQVVNMQDHSQFLTSLFPAEPYSKDPRRMALAAGTWDACTPQPCVGNVSRRTTWVDIAPGEALDDGLFPEDQPLVPMSVNGPLLSERSIPSHLSGRISCMDDHQRSGSMIIPALTLRQMATIAVLEGLNLDEYTPRVQRRKLTSSRRSARKPPPPLQPQLQCALAPGDPGMLHVSRTVTPVQEQNKPKKTTRDVYPGSLHSSWGRGTEVTRSGCQGAMLPPVRG